MAPSRDCSKTCAWFAVRIMFSVAYWYQRQAGHVISAASSLHDRLPHFQPWRARKFTKMNIEIFKDKNTLARAAADQAAASIRNAISDKGLARIIAATGASQFEFLDALTAMP